MTSDLEKLFTWAMETGRYAIRREAESRIVGSALRRPLQRTEVDVFAVYRAGVRVTSVDTEEEAKARVIGLYESDKMQAAINRGDEFD